MVLKSLADLVISLTLLRERGERERKRDREESHFLLIVVPRALSTPISRLLSPRLKKGDVEGGWCCSDCWARSNNLSLAWCYLTNTHPRPRRAPQYNAISPLAAVRAISLLSPFPCPSPASLSQYGLHHKDILCIYYGIVSDRKCRMQDYCVIYLHHSSHLIIIDRCPYSTSSHSTLPEFGYWKTLGNDPQFNQ